MLSFFMLQRNQLPWELTPTEHGCRLSLHHATGVIVEYFSSVAAALQRAQQLTAPVGPPRRLVRRRIRKVTRRRR